MQTLVTNPQTIAKITPIPLRVNSIQSQLMDIRSNLESKSSTFNKLNRSILHLFLEFSIREISILLIHNQKDQNYERIVNYTMKNFIDFMNKIVFSKAELNQDEITNFTIQTWKSLIQDFESIGIDPQIVQHYKNRALTYGIQL